MRPVELPQKVENATELHKKEKTAPRPFERKKTGLPEDTSMQEEMLNSIKDLLSRQKNAEAPAIANTATPAPVNFSSATSWQPSTQVLQLFEKMTDLLTYVDDKGIQTTSVTLGGDGFSNSVFQGCVLTITEYSTAPKIFNVQFSATPQAMAFFAPHAQQLQNALKQGEWDFRVERFDVELLDERDQEDDE